MRLLGVSPANSNDLVTRAYTDAQSAKTIPKTNAWFYPLSATASGTGVLTTGTLRLGPWLNRSPLTIVKVAMNVTVAGSSTSLMRLGIYNDDGSGYPGSLLADWGTVDCTTTGVKTITLGTSLVLPIGLYWIGGASQGTSGGQTMTLSAGSLDFVPNGMYASFATGTLPSFGQVHGFNMTGVTAALPSSFSSSLSTAGSVLRMAIGT